MAQEIRCLPEDHDAKLNMWEVRQFDRTMISSLFYDNISFTQTWLQVGKMSLYAASSAIREIQKIILDPKYG